MTGSLDAGRYGARWALTSACIQLMYAGAARCAALTCVAKSMDRRRLAGPPPGDWPPKSTIRTGYAWAMAAMSIGSRGSMWPLRSCALAVADTVTWLLARS